MRNGCQLASVLLSASVGLWACAHKTGSSEPGPGGPQAAAQPAPAAQLSPPDSPPDAAAPPGAADNPAPHGALPPGVAVPAGQMPAGQNVLVEPKPTAPPPSGAYRGTDKVLPEELAKSCDAVCAKLIECAPPNSITQEACTTGCNAAPGGAAVRIAVDHMNRCVNSGDCDHFNACMAAGHVQNEAGSAPPQSGPPPGH